MEKIGWIIFIDEFSEPPEASMAEVFCVIDQARWCMGYYQVRCSFSPKRKTHYGNKPAHLFFSILVYSTIIPSAA